MRNKISFALIFIAAVLIFKSISISQSGCPGGVCQLTGCDRDSVVNAISTAVAGDTILFPAATCTSTWTTKLTFGKAITLKGSTTINEVPGPLVGGPSPRPPTTNGSYTDKTIITRNFTTGQALIEATSSGSRAANGTGPLTRITGITFIQAPTSATNPGAGQAFINLSGYGNARVDHCRFDVFQRACAQLIASNDGVRGVIDHNVIHQSHTQTFYAQNGDTTGTVQGNPAWANPTGFGGPDFMYVEDNWVDHEPNDQGGAISDGDSGMKLAIRHNHIKNAVSFENHGTEGNRGGRAIYFAFNDIVLSGQTVDQPGGGGIRSGQVMAHDNTYDTLWGHPDMANCQVYRRSTCFPAQANGGMEGCDGSSAWDVNVNSTSGGGTYVPPSPLTAAPSPALAAWPSNQTLVGTSNALPASSVTYPNNPQVAVSPDPTSPVWTPNDKWKGYTLHKVSSSTAGAGRFSVISANDSHTASTGSSQSGFTGNSTMTWYLNDTFKIYYPPLVCIDQSGRGYGDLLTGAGKTATNSTLGRRQWPRQHLEPCYAWGNRATNQPSLLPGISSNTSTFTVNRDYFNEVVRNSSSVDGTGKQLNGVIVGGGRPTSGPTNGHDIAGIDPDANIGTVAYWDASASNAHGGRDTGALYVWSVASGWNTPQPGNSTGPWYQPYEYPHPCITSPTCAPGAVAPATINQTNAQFVKGRAVNCGTSTNCLQITTSNFSPAPNLFSIVWTGTNGAPPDVTFSTSGLLQGTAAGANPVQYNANITATNTGAGGSQTVTQAFVLTITAVNAAPSVAITAPTNGQSFDVTADNPITITATATDDSAVASVEFRDGTTTLPTLPGGGPTYSSSATLAVGSHTLTAIATDNGIPPLSTTSVPVTITVTQGGTPTPAPTAPASIIISPTTP